MCAGCLESFTEPVIKYGAAGVGVCADVYLLASVPAFADLRQKKREWAFKAGIAIWLACAVWTGLSSAKWLEHALEAAQAPVEQQEKTQAQTERERQDNLARERALLGKQDDAALNGKTKEVRDNAVKLAAETRTRIAELEKQNTFSAKTEPTPIKSPFAGYEKLVTFLLLAFSQGCWFMALDEEPAEAAVAEIGAARKPERAEISSENDAPVPPENSAEAGRKWQAEINRNNAWKCGRRADPSVSEKADKRGNFRPQGKRKIDQGNCGKLPLFGAPDQEHLQRNFRIGNVPGNWIISALGSSFPVRLPISSELPSGNRAVAGLTRSGKKTLLNSHE